MSQNGRTPAQWGCSVEGKPSAMLQAALLSVRRNGSSPQSLPACEGQTCDWAREMAECLRRGTCKAALVFCDDPGLACCVANKIPGVRAVAVLTVEQARLAIARLGANLLAVQQAGRTYFECRELMRLCEQCVSAVCPDRVACILKELDSHAHR